VGPGIELHDASANAQFNLVPRAVVVAAGGTVAFAVGVAGATGNNVVPHQVAVCRLGTTLEDGVDADLTTVPINDPDCPVAGHRRPRRRPPSRRRSRERGSTSLGATSSSATSGRTSRSSMYGWVNVK
jgi:hypothetical protein